MRNAGISIFVCHLIGLFDGKTDIDRQWPMARQLKDSPFISHKKLGSPSIAWKRYPLPIEKRLKK
jgi:hypothetical protein